MFSEEDIDQAITETNCNKGIGPDMFVGQCLSNQQIRERFKHFALEALNSASIPEHLRESKLVLFSKTSTNEAEI